MQAIRTAEMILAAAIAYGPPNLCLSWPAKAGHPVHTGLGDGAQRRPADAPVITGSPTFAADASGNGLPQPPAFAGDDDGELTDTSPRSCWRTGRRNCSAR